MSKKIELKKKLSVSAEMVFDVWLDPESLAKWMCPMPGVTVPRPILDARVGGQFKFDMHMGESVLPHVGSYQIIDRPKKLQFTWNSVNTDFKDSLVTIEIVSISNSECELTLIHELLPSEDSIKDHTMGWTNIIDCLEEEISTL